LAKKFIGYESWNSDIDQRRLIPDAETIFDVGANVGQTARTYHGLFPSAHIWSFEPFEQSYKALSSAVRDCKFHPNQLALSDEVGSSTLNIGTCSVTNSLLRRENDTGKSVEIHTDTIDHFSQTHGVSKIDILKMDVEGAESRVLRGAQGLFAQGAIRSVFLEVYFDPVYRGMPLMWDLHAQIASSEFVLHGLYFLVAGNRGNLSYGNALYILES
jgi:FkbM family methyltransferase